MIKCPNVIAKTTVYLYLSEMTTFFHPTYGNCFTFNWQHGTHFITRAGTAQVLQLIFGSPSDDYLPFNLKAGYKLLFHDPDEPRLMELIGIDGSPGYRYEFALRKVIFLNGSASTALAAYFIPFPQQGLLAAPWHADTGFPWGARG